MNRINFEKPTKGIANPGALLISVSKAQGKGYLYATAHFDGVIEAASEQVWDAPTIANLQAMLEAFPERFGNGKNIFVKPVHSSAQLPSKAGLYAVYAENGFIDTRAFIAAKTDEEYEKALLNTTLRLTGKIEYRLIKAYQD